MKLKEFEVHLAGEASPTMLVADDYSERGQFIVFVIERFEIAIFNTQHVVAIIDKAEVASAAERFTVGDAGTDEEG